MTPALYEWAARYGVSAEAMLDLRAIVAPPPAPEVNPW